MSRIEHFRQAIAPAREALLDHPLYQNLLSLNDLRLFAQHHVFAVWDFMSLLKSLQIQLTCTATPWMPVGDAATRYLINEIVLGEESDVDQNGNHTSHFELYLKAMHEMGAPVERLTRFLTALEHGMELADALHHATVPAGIQQFVQNTFFTIRQLPVSAQAAVFTFGREDLIPDMFVQMVRSMKTNFPGKVEVFEYYLERHIEIDGGHHAHLAQRMTEMLCGTDEALWKQAETAATLALESRKKLWDGILEEVLANRH